MKTTAMIPGFPPVYWAFIVSLILFLTACATGPQFDVKQFDQNITPEQAKNNVESLKESRILWGGIIVSSNNLENATQLEILNYPLDSNQKPDTSQAPRERFLVLKDQYLETVDYAPGRLVTLTGILKEAREGKVGESNYVYPVIQAEQIHLWSAGQTEPSVHFGLGVILSN